MSEAMHPDHDHNVLPFTKPNGEALERTDSLLALDDTSLSDDVISERVAEEIDRKDLLRLETREERSRYFINTALIIAGTTYHFADLRTKDRQDAIHTLAITKLVSEAERHLDNVEAQDGMRKLRAELSDIYDSLQDTNLIRTFKLLEKRYQTKYPAELVKAKHIALLVLATPRPE
jgi:hypothetical protein